MKLIFAVLICVHGLIHLLGFVKAFGLADIPQLAHPISRGVGLLWLLAAVLVIASGIASRLLPDGWWWVALPAVIVSQTVILTSWSDAKFGTIGNVLLLLGAVYGLLSRGPVSFRAEFDQAWAAERRETQVEALLAASDLTGLPPVLQNYIRLSGAVGRPRVRNFEVTYHGRIRSGPDARWMQFESRQFNILDDPKRVFLMRASLFGLPFEAIHCYGAGSATMRVKVASAVTVVHAEGPEMLRSETVTMFNDVCVLAPGALPFMHVEWEELSSRVIRGTYTSLGQTVSAVLTFGESGELVDFYSDDRSMSSPDGKSFLPARWQTPLTRYRDFGDRRLSSLGEARWKTEAADYTYGEFHLQSIRYNAGP